MFFKLRAKGAIVLIALIIPALLSASSAEAEELVISGNGSSSDSQITVAVTSETTVEQSNQGSIQNDVQLDLNTGENDTSDNTGADISITTGDISSQNSIQNIVNSSTTSLDCCPEEPSAITITDNGSNSQNSVNLNQNSDTQVSIIQNAYIQNNISGNANTGGNVASNNSGGNTSISTGDINANLNIENKKINAASVSAPQVNGDVNIKISGNGSSSNNLANISLNNNLYINIDNQADILNNTIWDLITGKNQAGGNAGGDVYIATGDIDFVAEIINGPINKSLVTIDCCNDINDQDDPGDPSDPDDPGDPGDPGDQGDKPGPPNNTTPPNNPGPGNGSPSNGQVLAALAAGQILPATGVSWTIILSLVSLIMFMLGLYLRLHPGQDPGVK